MNILLVEFIYLFWRVSKDIYGSFESVVDTNLRGDFVAGLHRVKHSEKNQPRTVNYSWEFRR